MFVSFLLESFCNKSNSLGEVAQWVKTLHKNQITGSNPIRCPIGCEVQPFGNIPDDLFIEIRTINTANNIPRVRLSPRQ